MVRLIVILLIVFIIWKYPALVTAVINWIVNCTVYLQHQITIKQTNWRMPENESIPDKDGTHNQWCTNVMSVYAGGEHRLIGCVYSRNWMTNVFIVETQVLIF